MQVAAVLRLLEQYLTELTRLRDLRYNHRQDFNLWCDKVAEVLKAAFGEGSDEYNKFAAARPRGVSLDTDPQTRQRGYLYAIELRETALKSILQKHEALSELQRQSGNVSEAVYPAGSPYDAYKAIRELIKQSSRQLTVADSYVNSTLVELLEVVPVGVSIRVLTRDMQGDFRLASSKFGQQRGNFEVRKEPGDLHDRYLIIDNEAYSLGASIKDAGTKMCGIHRIEQPQVKQVVMTLIEDLWKKSAKVV